MNRSFKKMSTILGAGVVALAATAPVQAVLVGWNYVNGFNDGGGAASLAPVDIAGAPGFAQANWNNHIGSGQGPGTVPFALVDSTGAASGISVTGWTQSSNNSWHLDDHASPDAKLLDGFANQQASISFGGLSSAFTSGGYAVVVYYSNNEGPTNSTLSVNGGVDDAVARAIRTGNTAQSSFSSVGYLEGTASNSASVSNYTVFTGLNDSTFSVSMTGGGNNGIAGIQIVSADELPPPPPAGDKIGWNFVMRNGSQLAAGESAGFTGFEQVNWNNDGPNGQGSSGGIANLMDNNGLPTDVAVSWTGSGNSWNLNGPLASPDGKLNDGFLNQRPSVTVSGLSEEFGEDGYSLIVYYNNNEGPGTSDVTVAGILDDLIVQRMITGPTGSTRFEENGYLLEEGLLAGATNVMIFEGLDDLGFVLSFATVSGNGNNGITAFQIVKNFVPSIPEPTTAMLLSFATCGLALVRRSRREASVNA